MEGEMAIREGSDLSKSERERNGTKKEALGFCF